jgi:hypothetical protein
MQSSFLFLRWSRNEPEAVGADVMHALRCLTVDWICWANGAGKGEGPSPAAAASSNGAAATPVAPLPADLPDEILPFLYRSEVLERDSANYSNVLFFPSAANRLLSRCS